MSGINDDTQHGMPCRNDRQGVLYHIAIAAGVTWDIVPALLSHATWTPDAHAAFPPAFKVPARTSKTSGMTDCSATACFWHPFLTIESGSGKNMLYLTPLQAAARLVVTAAQIGRRASCAAPNTRKRWRDETDGGGTGGSGGVGGSGASSTCAVSIRGVDGGTRLGGGRSGAATSSGCHADSIATSVATTAARRSGSCGAQAATAAGASTAGMWSLSRDLVEQILAMAALPMCTWCSFRLTVPPRRPGKPRMITTRRRRSSISSSAVSEVAVAHPAVIADGGGTAASAAGAA